jgi:hypothetical protein
MTSGISSDSDSRYRDGTGTGRTTGTNYGKGPRNEEASTRLNDHNYKNTHSHRTKATTIVSSMKIKIPALFTFLTIAVAAVSDDEGGDGKANTRNLRALARKCPKDVFDVDAKSCKPEGHDCFYEDSSCQVYNAETKLCEVNVIQLPCFCDSSKWICAVLSCLPCPWEPEPVPVP